MAQKVLPVDVEMVHGYPGCWLVPTPVHDQHLVAATVQPFHDTATDERRAAQHQDPHGSTITIAATPFLPLTKADVDLGYVS